MVGADEMTIIRLSLSNLGFAGDSRPDEVYLPRENANAQVDTAERRFRADRDWLPLGDDPAREGQLTHLLTNCGVEALADREWSEAA